MSGSLSPQTSVALSFGGQPISVFKIQLEIDLNRRMCRLETPIFDYSRSEKDMHFEWASFGGNLSLVGAHFRASVLLTQVDKSREHHNLLEQLICVAAFTISFKGIGGYSSGSPMVDLVKIRMIVSLIYS